MPWEAADRQSCMKAYRAPRRDADGYSTSGASAWSTLRDAERNICFNIPLAPGRRLRKQRSPPRTPSSPASPSSSSSSSSPAPSPFSSPRGPAPPADPREVLARRHYNHTPAPSSSSHTAVGCAGSADGHTDSDCGSSGSQSPSPSRRYGSPIAALRRKKSLLQRVVPACRRGGDAGDERWVYVDVEHKVTQRVCAVGV